MIISRVIAVFIVLATVTGFAAEFVIDFSVDNITCDCFILVSSLMTFWYLVATDAFLAQPLSAFAIFGFCITTQLGALIAQAVAWTPLTNSLYDPIATFGTLAFYQTLAVLVHAAYRFFANSTAHRTHVLRTLMGSLHVYDIPRPGVLWLMGVLGLVSFGFSTGHSILSKVGEAFGFLTWAPFLIPIYSFHGDGTYCNRSRMFPLLGLYAMAVGLVGVALNFRGVIFFGAITVALLYLLEGLRSTTLTTWGAIVKFMAVVGIAALTAGPVSDLATSMAIARNARGRVSAAEMVMNTFYIYNKKHLIDAYRAQEKAASIFGSYDEHYLSNPMMARLVETKFHDNALYFASTLRSADSKQRLMDVTVDSFWAVLPSPLLAAFNIHVDKDAMRFSMGDYLAFLSRGIPLGGYKTGSVFAQGYVLFGILFPLVYAMLCLILFGIMDLLTLKSATGKASISALGMMKIWQFFLYGVTAEGLNSIFVFIVRDFAQMVLIYFVVFVIARLLLRQKPSAREQAPPQHPSRALSGAGR